MAKKSKRYQEVASKIDRQKQYSVEEAVELAKETSIANFDASVEVAFRLGPFHVPPLVVLAEFPPTFTCFCKLRADNSEV